MDQNFIWLKEAIQDIDVHFHQLHAELNEAYYHKGLAKRAYVKLQQQMAALNSAIKCLHDWRNSDEEARAQEEFLGLPALERCSHVERRIVLHFLQERERILAQLLQETARVLKIVEATLRGNSWQIVMTFWMSWLKRRLNAIERWFLAVEADHMEVERRMAQLGSLLSKTDRNYEQKSNLELIVEKFKQMDEAASRCDALRREVSAEEERTAKMRQWIEAMRQELHFAPARPALPNPEDLEFASAAAFSPQLSQFENTRQRLTLAHNYVSNCISKAEEDVVQQRHAKRQVISPRSIAMTERR